MLYNVYGALAFFHHCNFQNNLATYFGASIVGIEKTAVIISEVNVLEDIVQTERGGVSFLFIFYKINKEKKKNY